MKKNISDKVDYNDIRVVERKQWQIYHTKKSKKIKVEHKT